MTLLTMAAAAAIFLANRRIGFVVGVVALLLLLPVLALSSSSSSGGGGGIGGGGGFGKTDVPPAAIKSVVVVGGTHGNEYTGVWCIKALEKTAGATKTIFPSLRVSTLLGNPEAWIANRRFIDEDLNRQFSYKALEEGTAADGGADAGTTLEGRRAQEINQLLGPKFQQDESMPYKADVIVDLHTSTSNMGTALIVAEGDPLMCSAAAFVLKRCAAHDNNSDDIRILLHTHPTREARPNLSSTGRHGFTVEVGPVPQGVLRHDAIERTQRAVDALFEFLHRHNVDRQRLRNELLDMYSVSADTKSSFAVTSDPIIVPCFHSAPAIRKGEMSGKLRWPSDPENPNFPAFVVHKHLQGRDFQPVYEGDPLFVDLEGNVVPYDGSHGSPVYLMFINEGGYYYASSGTGIAVAVQDGFDLNTGMLISRPRHYHTCHDAGQEAALDGIEVEELEDDDTDAFE